MNKNINKLAFTLIEILVGITIVGIIILSSRNISFKNMSDRQKLEIFNNKIISEIEKVRNDSLIGKGIGVSLDVPPEWKIEFSKSGSGRIVTSYISGTNRIIYNDIPKESFEISNIYCKNITGIENSITGTGTIIFIKGKYKLGGDCTENLHSELKIETFNKGYYKTFSFDTISGIIKR